MPSRPGFYMGWHKSANLDACRKKFFDVYGVEAEEAFIEGQSLFVGPIPPTQTNPALKRPEQPTQQEAFDL